MTKQLLNPKYGNKNMSNLKIVFIGCGSHANCYIYPSLMNIEGMELSAVCSLDMEEAEVNRKKHGANQAYTDYREMIQRERPDGVIIVGPPQLHYEAGTYCLGQRIPFFIEKPPGANLEQASELAEAADKNNCFGQVGFMMRHSAVVKKIDNIAEKEKLGKVLHGIIRYFTSGPYRHDEIYGMPGTDDLSYLWRYLMVQAVHPVNLAASFLDEIIDIRPKVIFSGENIVVNIQLQDCENRYFNVILHTLVAPGYGNLQFGTELFFERRAMILAEAFSELNYYPSEPPAEYLESNNGNSINWKFATFGNNNIKMGYQTEMAAFIESLKSGTPTCTDLNDALKTMHILTESFNQIKSTIQ